MKYAVYTGKPVPASLLPELQVIGVGVNSCLRTQDAVTWARNQGCSLSSQAELYQGYITGQPGYNPANPPGYSTHELRSDGIAYGWIPRGSRLPFEWMVGIDSADSARAIANARSRGWLATITYPSSPSEGHHINFRKKPVVSLPVLKFGSKGPRVRKLTGRLSRLKLVHEKDGTYLNSPTSTFNSNVKDAVVQFQRDHHLTADGIVGSHTQKQIRVAIRRQRKQK